MFRDRTLRAACPYCLAPCATTATTPKFRVGELPPSWHKVDSKSDLAFRSNEGGTIYANVDCDPNQDAPLDVLTNHLLFGVDVKMEQRAEMTLAGRKALRTRIHGEVDGVPVELDTIVMKKNGCVYDLGLAAGPDTFDTHEHAFEEFIAGFETREDFGNRPREEGIACSVTPC